MSYKLQATVGAASSLAVISNKPSGAHCLTASNLRQHVRLVDRSNASPLDPNRLTLYALRDDTVIGLTGGIASGKSTVSSYLHEKHGLPIIDADYLARAVIEPGTTGYQAIVDHFGKRVLQDDGVQLDRKAISDIVFNDEKERKVLNGIVHPAVRKAMAWEVTRYWMQGHWACILDVPLLIEAGLYKWVGEIIVVYVNESLQLARLQDRPSPNPNEARLTSSQAQARIRSQMALSDKLKYADYVVDNSGTKPELERQLDVWVNKIKSRSDGWKKTVYWLVPPIGLWGALVTLGARTWKRYRAKL